MLRAEGGVLHYQRIGKTETAEIIVNRTEHIIVFDGSPVKKVEYDGESHGLSAGAYPTLGGKRIADADMYYVGVQEDGTYYSSSKAPTEPGYYYVAATAELCPRLGLEPPFSRRCLLS